MKRPELDNYGKPRSDYLAKISGLNDADLLDETEHKIWLSAFAASNPRSDYHWHADACYDEWVKRKKVFKYSIALDNAKKNCGH